MKNYFYFALIFPTLLLVSCNNVQKKVLKETDTIITFKVGFPSWRVKYFKDNGLEYLAFSDFVTNKEISVNSLNGKQLFVVPLKNAMIKERVSFFAFDVVSLDTFVLLSKQTNKVIFVDSNGIILFKKDYSKFLLKGYTLYPPFHYKRRSLFSCLDWGPPTNSEISETIFYKLKHNSYHLLIDNLGDSTKDVKLSLDSIYSRFANDKEMTLENPNLIMKGNEIVFASIFSDSLYIFNNKYKLDTIIKVKSKYYPIDFSPISLEYARNHSNATLSSGPISKHSMITQIKYDEINQILYCFISGPMDGKKYSFSIIIFDKDFNKLDEKLFKNTNFTYYSFIGKKGLYIRIKGDDLQETTYKLFRYE